MTYKHPLHWPNVLFLTLSPLAAIVGAVTYMAHPLVRFFYLVFGACAMQNSTLNWASDHRMHHRFTDTDADPYNAGQGFWHSHIGWIFYQSRQEKQLTNVGDLMRDPLVRWQHRYPVEIALIVG